MTDDDDFFWGIQATYEQVLYYTNAWHAERDIELAEDGRDFALEFYTQAQALSELGQLTAEHVGLIKEVNDSVKLLPSKMRPIHPMQSLAT